MVILFPHGFAEAIEHKRGGSDDATALSFFDVLEQEAFASLAEGPHNPSG